MAWPPQRSTANTYTSVCLFLSVFNLFSMFILQQCKSDQVILLFTASLWDSIAQQIKVNVTSTVCNCLQDSPLPTRQQPLSIVQCPPYFSHIVFYSDSGLPTTAFFHCGHIFRNPISTQSHTPNSVFLTFFRSPVNTISLASVICISFMSRGSFYTEQWPPATCTFLRLLYLQSEFWRNDII